MFIKEGVIDLLPVHPYQLDYLQQELDDLKPNQRAFISRTNSQYGKVSDPACRYVSNYLASQHHPALASFVPRRFHVVEQAQADPELFFNTTYFDRVCHAVFVPMQGSVTYAYSGLPERVFRLEPGRAYAVNTRAARGMVDMTPGFRCFVSLWIDFDLAFYLKDYDGNGKMERKRDEYFDRPQQPAEVQAA